MKELLGLELVKMIFNQVDDSLKITFHVKDGDNVKFGDVAFVVEGNSISILTVERLVLNCIRCLNCYTKTSI